MPLYIYIAPDKFKDSLSSDLVASSIKKGLKSNYPDAVIGTQMMSDGGEGALTILKQKWGLEKVEVNVSDPLFRKHKSYYYRNNSDAFIELATASGLHLLKQHERNCMHTTTYGTGLLILHAIKQGIRIIHLFIGGSATCDAAMGIAEALGIRFLDENNQKLSPVGGSLNYLSLIENSHRMVGEECKFQVICDVTNPFYGKQGAAFVYAPQKGASASEVQLLDEGLQNINHIFVKQGYGDVSFTPGAGAAGGVGGGMQALFGAELKKGFDWFCDRFDVESHIQKADIVISGEGQLDLQSLQGKVVGGIAALCEKYQKPFIVICGTNKLGSDSPQSISHIYSLMDIAPNKEEAMARTEHYIETLVRGSI